MNKTIVTTFIVNWRKSVQYKHIYHRYWFDL